jgi:hypothetical protein
VPSARGIADSCGCAAKLHNFLAERWGLPPPQPRFPLRSVCLADGSISRATKRFFRIFELQVEAASPTPPLSAALGLSCRRLAAAGNEALLQDFKVAGGGCPTNTPASRYARLVLQTVRYRGQRSASSGLLSRSRGLLIPHPRFPLRSACLADGSLLWATKRFFRIFESQLGVAAPTPPLFAALGLSCRQLATAGYETLLQDF